jgi:HSP20 family protein
MESGDAADGVRDPNFNSKSDWEESTAMALPILRRGGNAVPVHRGSGAPLTRIDPWNDFEQMDRIFNSFFGDTRWPFSVFDRSNSAQGTGAQMELYETDDELIAVALAPGFKKDDFNIAATAGTLSVQGERKALWENTEGMRAHTPWTTMAAASTFQTEYNLPVEIDPNKVRATYTDGVLEIHLAKADSVKPKQVKIEVRDN